MGVSADAVALLSGTTNSAAWLSRKALMALTDKREYVARAREIGAAYRELIGSFSVAMTAVQVSALIEDRAQVEIEVTAVVPD